MKKDEFIKKIDEVINESNIVDLTVALCSQNTINPAGNEYLCTPALKEFFESKMKVSSIDIYEKIEGRTNLIANLKGKNEGKKLAIVGHVDVVDVKGQNWETDPFVPVVKDGNIFARGAADNKGPFAAVIEGVRIFNTIVRNEFDGEISILSCADEEQSSNFGIKYLFNEVGLKYDYALVPDGGEFTDITYGEMGVLTLEITSAGKAYHGSMPEKGIDAIAPLAMLVTLLHDYDWNNLKGDEAFDHTVMNTGLISGGTAKNIVPDVAKLSIMWRYPVGVEIKTITNIVDDLIKKVKEKYTQANIVYRIDQMSYPMLSNPHGRLIDVSLQSSKDLGLHEQHPRTIRAETVAKYIYQATKCEVIVNGPLDGSTAVMHRPNEHIEVKALVDFAKYYALILYNLFINQDD